MGLTMPYTGTKGRGEGGGGEEEISSDIGVTSISKWLSFTGW